MILLILLFRIVLFIVPTHGEKISDYTNPKSALLVIDMQEDLIGEKTKAPHLYKNPENLINNVNNIIDMAMDKKYKVLYIRQEYKNNLLDMPLSRGTLISGHSGAELDSRLKMVSEDVFIKRQSDSFSSKEIENFLISNEVDKLYIVGLDANGCVYRSAKGGLNRNYRVSIIQDGITTTNIDKMDGILKKYVKNNISVINSSDFKNLE